jgi:DNA-binding MarR family transcriptional regulator
MPAKRELTMRQLRQMLRLHHDGLGAREIGRRLGVARSTIQDNLKRVEAAGLAWPLAPDVSDEVLEQRLFSNSGSKRAVRRRTEPDWAALARELKRPGVNLVVLWEEYRVGHPDGYGYSSYVAARFMLCKELYFRGFLNTRALFTQHNRGLDSEPLSNGGSLWIRRLIPTT